MDIHLPPADLPVILLYNLDRNWPANDISESQQAADFMIENLRQEGHPVRVLCLETDDLAARLMDFNPNDGLVFNWCEEIPGLPHSCARVAEILEQAGFTYTGADARGLALSMNKPRVKRKLESNNVPTPAWKIFDAPCCSAWQTFPAIVKPAHEHSSIGVTRHAVCQTPGELTARVAYVLETFGQPALVEKFIDGREFHVTVLGNGVLHVLPPAEMDFSAFAQLTDRLCTYESKFDPSSVSYKDIKLKLPAQLTRAELADLERQVLTAYQACGCRDYARLDIRLLDGTFYVLDVNPNADISPDTSLALSAELTGLSYGKFASYLVNLAARRHAVFGRSELPANPALSSLGRNQNWSAAGPGADGL